MFGALAIGLKDLNLNLEYLQGDSIALVGTILYSAYLLCIEKLRTQFDSNVIFFWRCLVSSILMLPIVLVIQAQLFPESPLGFIFLISLVCSSSLSQLLVVYILKTLSAGLVALAMLIDPILTAILAGLLFAEQLSIESWLLFSVVLFGVYLAIINQPEAASDLA
jgi:drug/metabolite transporter (DMT)-like permease